MVVWADKIVVWGANDCCLIVFVGGGEGVIQIEVANSLVVPSAANGALDDRGLGKGGST